MTDWLIASYEPVTLFSLRMTHATSKGGKTLVTPTPYSVKMALIDACFRRFNAFDAEAQARRVFDLIKARQVRALPPEQCVVQNTFIKILDQSRDESGDWPFRQTIAYREFAFFSGKLRMALHAAGMTGSDRQTLIELFAHINTFGKRGSFWQFCEHHVLEGDLPPDYCVRRDQASPAQIVSHGMTQALDDFGPALVQAKDGFDRISTYGRGTVKIGEHRVIPLTAIPYRRRSAGRSFTWYERSTGAAGDSGGV